MANTTGGTIVDETRDQPQLVSIGPTTSMRMEKFEKDFLAHTGVKLVVGKGGMGADTPAGPLHQVGGSTPTRRCREAAPIEIHNA